MKHKSWFFVEGSQTWVNLMRCESVFRVKSGWRVVTNSGKEVPLTDSEYEAVAEILKQQEPKKPEE